MLTIVVIQSFMHRLGSYIYMQRKSTFMENQSTESTYGTCLFYLSYTYSFICSHYLSIADSLKRFSFCCIISSLGVAYGVFVINIFYQYKKTQMNVEWIFAIHAEIQLHVWVRPYTCELYCPLNFIHCALHVFKPEIQQYACLKMFNFHLQFMNLFHPKWKGVWSRIHIDLLEVKISE